MQDEIVKFLRKRDYKLIRELGQGACGKTILLYDEMIDQYYVCKKYLPAFEDHRQELFINFIREIKLLHQIYHHNIVRVYNHYLYPENFAGYILMEFINGDDIDEYLKKSPEKINEIFLQTINGFMYLEQNNILHRDIRIKNILINKKGMVKIIDLGFGKQIKASDDFDKSISLNWWCEPPDEFNECKYDFKTEVYFVGKLFEKIIFDHGIDSFKYKRILMDMCNKIPESRICGFLDIQRQIQSNMFYEIDFSILEKDCYRNFADNLAAVISKIENGAKYIIDIENLQLQLENIYRSCMLEDIVPDSSLVVRCFLNGNYYYYKQQNISVAKLKNFIGLLKSSSQEKKRIIISNLHTRLNSLSRYEDDKDDDIPF